MKYAGMWHIQEMDMWNSDYLNALFLASDTVSRGTGRLDPSMVNRIMKEVCQVASVENLTPHSARDGGSSNQKKWQPTCGTAPTRPY